MFLAMSDRQRLRWTRSLLLVLVASILCQLALASAEPAIDYHAAGQQVLVDSGSNRTASACPEDLIVRTTLFTYQGAVNKETPQVRQFLGIPFAEPPVGPLRFRPPVTKRPLAEGAVVDATRYGSYCYQHDNGDPGFFRTQPGHSLPNDLRESEDCLTLDVWTRRTPCQGGGSGGGGGGGGGDSGSGDAEQHQENKKAAVLIWIHGGALRTGDSATSFQRGNRLVANHDGVVVVSVNYRVNIFGFPRAGGLDGRHLNPGFLDVRLAVEWVYHNIAAFGGDPTRMILFGNSAGSTQVDKYAYAWAHDPLVTGYICMSGQGEFSADPADVSNFTYVAERVGCGGFIPTNDDGSGLPDYDGELACMQEADADAIIGVLNGYDSRLHGGSGLDFQPQTDNQTSFGNYTDLQVRGMYSKLVSLLQKPPPPPSVLWCYVLL